MKKPQFVSNQIYHIYNRGVEKRNVFLSDQDYFRFIHDLFEFNDETPASNIDYYFKRQSAKRKSMEVELPYVRRRRKMLVEILVFCLMPNHYHLLLRQKKDKGIVRFMQKLGTGYTNYFNQKYERVGSLFQGRFKAVLVEKEGHFVYLPYYIHLNPLDLVTPEWREGKIKNYDKAIKFLDSYRWSSHLDYTGKRNFPSIIQEEFFSEIFEGEENYRKNILEWFEQMDAEKFLMAKEVALE